jgi:small-conductance mechanosensitive channel
MIFLQCERMDIKNIHEQEAPPGAVAGSNTAHKLWIGSYTIIGLVTLAVHFLIRLRILDIFGAYRLLALRLSLGLSFVSLVLIVAKWTEGLVKKHSHIRANRYNVIRLVRLLCVLLVIFIVISFLFENWYTAAVSLGLFSLILGFALQTPIASLISWFYIVIRAPYKVGDRIQIDTFTGDVVEINYLDTTLWEFGGNYLTGDLPSGRLIRFPNSLVLQAPVYNYSWKKFPYIWNEIPFHIAYESDLAYVEDTLRRVTKSILGAGMTDNIRQLKEIIEQTPVDELEIKEYSFVYFRVNANTWVEALVIYLVEPKKATAVRSNIIKAVVPELLKQPDKVMFPKSNAR